MRREGSCARQSKTTQRKIWIDYHLDEIEVIEINTDSDILRQRCAEARRQYGKATALHIA